MKEITHMNWKVTKRVVCIAATLSSALGHSCLISADNNNNTAIRNSKNDRIYPQKIATVFGAPFQQVMSVSPSGHFQKMVFSLDGSRLVTLSWESLESYGITRRGGKSIVEVWSVENGQREVSLPTKISSASIIEIVPQKGTLLVGGCPFSSGSKIFMGGFPVAWDLTTGSRLRELCDNKYLLYETNTFAVSPDGKSVACGGRLNEVQLVDLQKRAVVATLRQNDNHHSNVTCIKFSPDGKLLAVNSDALRLWVVATRKQYKPRRANMWGTDVSNFVFTPTGKQLLITKHIGPWIHVYNVASRRHVSEWCAEEFRGNTLPNKMGTHTNNPHWKTRLNTTPDGNILAVGTWLGKQKQSLTIRRAEDFKNVFTFPNCAKWPVVFSRDGKRIATFSTNDKVIIWEQVKRTKAYSDKPCDRK